MFESVLYVLYSIMSRAVFLFMFFHTSGGLVLADLPHHFAGINIFRLESIVFTCATLSYPLDH